MSIREIGGTAARKVYVVVPCFNEGDALRETVAELARLGVSVVVVDDGSRPPAFGGRPYPGTHLLRHTINLGQGAALQTGMDYALAQGAEVLIHFDGDGQHDPTAIAGMVEMLGAGTAEVVLGSRFLDPAHAEAVPPRKRWVLRTGILVSWMFSGLWLTDTHNGFRGFRRRAAEQIRLKENGFGHATEILGQIREAKLSYREMPTLVRYSDYSVAKGQRMSNSLNLVIDLLLRRLL